MNDTLINLLLKYQSLGWHLTSCSSKSKAPILSPTEASKGGWYRASPSSGDWMEWAKEYKGCMWGVRPMGFAVLDADVKHKGTERLAYLTQQYGSLPKTPTVKTGGGGRHYYFKTDKTDWTGNFKLGCEGLELISTIKGVIVPPSIHPDWPHNIYEWEVPPWDCPMADLPAWLLEVKRGTTEKPKASEPVNTDELLELECGSVGFDGLGLIPSGRNMAIAKAIADEKLSGTTEHECLRKGLTWARNQTPAYDEAELRRKIKSIYDNENFKPGGFILSPDVSEKKREESCNPDEPEDTGRTLHADAYHGIFGDMLRAIEGQTEADPVGVCSDG